MVKRAGVTAILFGMASVAAWGNSELFSSSQMLDSKLKALPGEYVLLAVWSPFCAPCSEEVSELNQAIAQARGKLSVLGIPVQSREREISAFVAHFKPRYEQWKPDSGFVSSLKKQGLAVPRTFLLDKSRTLIKQWTGKVATHEILSEIERNVGETH